MKVSPVKNQYRGINAHLHSLWQAEGGWNEFHTAHIMDLLKLMRQQLIHHGYKVEMQSSIQIRRLEAIDGENEHPLSEKPFRALQISGGTMPVWIELLAPASKSRGADTADAEEYQRKRLKLLQTEAIFVELDYLHQSSSTFDTVPIAGYRRLGFDSDNYPYRIVLINPHSGAVYTTGETHKHEFCVDEPIPVIEIPLKSGHKFRFDFNTPYHKTIEELLYTQLHVDYCCLPVNFNWYRPHDRARIVSRMLNVLERAERGDNLEQTPGEIETIPLEEGLKRLEVYQVNL